MKVALYPSFTDLLFLVAMILVASVAADDRSGVQSFEDNRDHWLFEFDLASKKPLGTRDDASSITALLTLEAQRTVKGAHAGPMGIRWVSSTLAIAKTTITGAAPIRQLLCVCEKRESGWQLLYVYRFPLPSLTPKERPNQAMQPTAGRCESSQGFMREFSMPISLAFASCGCIVKNLRS